MRAAAAALAFVRAVERYHSGGVFTSVLCGQKRAWTSGALLSCNVTGRVGVCGALVDARSSSLQSFQVVVLGFCY